MIVWTVLIAILKILGSLGIFLYGMKVMSEGIQRQPAAACDTLSLP